MQRKGRGFYGNYEPTPSTASKKKKSPKNAFFFYMQDFRDAQETKGIFYRTQKEVADAAASSWEQLPDEQRKYYQDAAKEAKERDKTDLMNKFTTEGKSYAEVNKEEQERREKQEKMLQEIRSTIRSLRTPSALNNYPLHLIHVNYYCMTSSGLYVPCELAISEFTILDGVKRLFHVLIHPGEIPLGYKHDAIKHSEETHKIPLPGEFDFEGIVQDYAKIFQCLQSFLREAKAEYKLPPLYTVGAQLEPCENVLTMLCDSVDKDNIFRVYPLKELFFELQHACVDVFKPTDESIVKLPYVSIAERELEKHIFDYNTHIACDFHKVTDAVPYCSLSCVRKWSFLILDYCHQVTKMPLIPGKHVPEHTNVSQKSRPFVQQRKCDTEELSTTMQHLRVTSSLGANSLEVQTRGQAAETLRASKKVSEAIRLPSPDNSDEFPPLGS